MEKKEKRRILILILDEVMRFHVGEWRIATCQTFLPLCLRLYLFRSMSMASKPQRIRKSLELRSMSMGFHCFFVFFVLTQKLKNPSSLIWLVPWLCFRIIWLMLLRQLAMAFPSVEVLFCSLSNTHLLLFLCGLNSLNFFSPLANLVYDI